jgi:hypothetical protein
MTISNAEKTKLNKSNRAMQDASGGTVLQNAETLVDNVGSSFASGSLTVTEAQINASAISLTTGQTGMAGFIVQRYMSGSQISDVKVVNSGSILDITAGSGSPLATGDVIYWVSM